VDCRAFNTSSVASGFVSLEHFRPMHLVAPFSLADANDRRSALRDAALSRRAPPVAPSPTVVGDEGSDPAPTRESTANPDFRTHADTAIPKLFCSRLRRAGGTPAICGLGALARAVVEKGPSPKTRASTSRRADGEDRKRRWGSTTGHGLPDLVCPSANAYLVPLLPRRSRRHMFSALIFPFRGVHGLRCGALPALRKTRH
jgi:hypothetical protein